MAEKKEDKKSEEGKKKGIISETADQLMTLTSIGAIGTYVAKKIWDKVGEKFVNTAVDKIEEAIGISTKKAEISSKDEFYYGSMIREYRHMPDPGPEKAKKVRAFKAELDKDTKQRGRGKAFVLFIAQAVENFSITKKPRQQGNQQKPKGGAATTDAEKNNEDYSFKDISGGVAWAIDFVDELLEEDSYEKRVQFLKDNNVFALISAPGFFEPVIETAKELGKDGIKKGQELAVEAGKKIVEHHKVNVKDLDSSSKSGLERARAFRDRMRGSRP